MEILGFINGALAEMTRSEHKVAIFCLNNINGVAFDTLEATAEKIGTSTTSVIRFCRRLGFPGYKDFQDRIRRELKMQPSLPDKYERTARLVGEDSLSLGICSAAVSCILNTFGGISAEVLSLAVDRLSSAARVFTFGMRESFALAHYAYTRFLSVRRDVSILGAGYNGEIEPLISLTPNDVCVVYLFHRYTRAALDVVRLIKESGATVILVTSPPYDSELAAGSLLIPCDTDVSGIKNSAAAPIVLTDYLCNAVALSLGDGAVEYMKRSEELFDKFSVLSDF